MKYGYDIFGWYIGEVDDSRTRATDVEPVNKALTCEPGAMRSNWTGSQWIELAYFHQDVDLNVPETRQIVSPIEFKLLFTFPELVAIRTAVNSDPILKEIYDITQDPRLTGIDLSLNAVSGALDYLISQNLIAPERKAQIQSGVIK